MLAETFLDQVSCKIADQEVNLLQWINIFRIAREWRNGRRLNRILGDELDKCFEKLQHDPSGESNTKRSIMDLTLQGYLAEQSTTASTLEENYHTIRTSVIHHLRMFLFVGHDSISSEICYAYYLLATHPDVLQLIRAEHDAVFGPDLTTVNAQILDNPRIVNQLPYTQAVIKEALRLFPAGGCVRDGRPGVELVDDQGRRYPTEGCILFITHYHIQRCADYWPEPDAFKPERWLVGADHELYPRVKGAWRPFEHGPRQCIGQALAMTEMKILLAMVIREFDIEPAYEEYDRLYPSKGAKTIYGERAYLRDVGAAHPADHFPCRVHLNKRSYSQGT